MDAPAIPAVSMIALPRCAAGRQARDRPRRAIRTKEMYALMTNSRQLELRIVMLTGGLGAIAGVSVAVSVLSNQVPGEIWSPQGVLLVFFPTIGWAVTWVILARLIRYRSLPRALLAGLVSPIVCILASCGGTLLITYWFPYVALPIGLVTGAIVNQMLPRRPCPGFCQRCGYNLAGNVSGQCPECGLVSEAAKRRAEAKGSG